MYVPQILMCLFLSMFLEVMLLSNIIFTYLLMGLMFCLIFIENINDGFQYEEAFTVNKDSSGNFDYPFVILSSGREKKFGKNDLIELSRDISTKDDKKHGVVKYMIDSQNICP